MGLGLQTSSTTKPKAVTSRAGTASTATATAAAAAQQLSLVRRDDYATVGTVGASPEAMQGDLHKREGGTRESWTNVSLCECLQSECV